jgi:hypothetical protein
MLSLEQLRWRLAEKGYRHRAVERLLRATEVRPIPPEVWDQVERLLEFDWVQTFIAWFGECHYRSHYRQAIIDCGAGRIARHIDYLRRLG